MLLAQDAVHIVTVLIAAVHKRNRHAQTVAAAPSHVICENNVVRLAVIIIQRIGREGQPLLFYAVLHEKALEIRRVDGVLKAPPCLFINFL